MTPEERAAAEKAKADADRQKLNDALDVDWDTLQRKLMTKVEVFLNHLGQFVRGDGAESTAEFPINDKTYYFSLSVRPKVPPAPKKGPRFVMWEEGNPTPQFAYTEQDRSTFLDANPSFKYAQIPQE